MEVVGCVITMISVTFFRMIIPKIEVNVRVFIRVIDWSLVLVVIVIFAAQVGLLVPW
jgi:hypothetical protein